MKIRSLSPRHAAGCAAAAVLSAIGGQAFADPAPSYDALVGQRSAAPLNVEATALVEAAEARARQAGVRPNPELSLDFENVFGAGPYTGTENGEATVTVSQSLELWGRRQARQGLAQAEVTKATDTLSASVKDSFKPINERTTAIVERIQSAR